MATKFFYAFTLVIRNRKIHEISFHLFQNSFKKDIFAEIIGWWQ